MSLYIFRLSQIEYPDIHPDRLGGACLDITDLYDINTSATTEESHSALFSRWPQPPLRSLFNSSVMTYRTKFVVIAEDGMMEEPLFKSLTVIEASSSPPWSITRLVRLPVPLSMLSSASDCFS